MKKILLIFIFTLLGFMAVYSQPRVATAAYVRGYWTSWVNRSPNIGSTFQDIYVQPMHRGGTFSGMEIRKNGMQPWDWCFKFEIDNYVKPDKKARKQNQKSNTWYVYSGWVEYYVTDEFPTISKVLEYYQFPLIQPTGDTARAKRRARATIKIAPYKKAPECFNIYFDGVAVGISFDKCPADKTYFVR